MKCSNASASALAFFVIRTLGYASWLCFCERTHLPLHIVSFVEEWLLAISHLSRVALSPTA